MPWLLGWLALTLKGSRWFGWHGAADGRGRLGRIGLWGACWSTLAVATGLSNLWNLPLIGFGLAVWAGVALLRRKRLSVAVAVWTGVLVVLVFAGARLIRGHEGLPLPSATQEGWLGKLPLGRLSADLRSTPAQLFAVWGWAVLLLAAGCHQRLLAKGKWIALLAVDLGWLALAGLWAALGSRLPGGTAWVWVAAALWFAAQAWDRRPRRMRRELWLGIALCVMLAGLELVYVTDRFVGEYARYNTYYKLSYPVWAALTVLAVASGRRMWIANPSRWRLWLARLFFCCIFAAALSYSVFAFPARIAWAKRGDEPPRRPTLNGYDFLSHRPKFAVEEPLLAWIRANVPPGQVVVEAVRPQAAYAYCYSGRVASLGGRPVPMGWAHHEQQWRGEGAFQAIAGRMEAVDRLYRAASPAQLRIEASGLGARWIVYGLMEEQYYGPQALRMLKQTAGLAASFPPGRPRVYLFDLERPATGDGLH